MMITKNISIDYTPIKYMYTFRGWLFLYWRDLPTEGYFAGFRLFGITIKGYSKGRGE